MAATISQVRIDAVDPADVRMIERRQGPRLTIAGFSHFPRPACADGRDKLVAADFSQSFRSMKSAKCLRPLIESRLTVASRRPLEWCQTGEVLDDALREELKAMKAEDLRVREELSQGGELGQGYAPRMGAVHRRNASRLQEIVTAHGWPDRELWVPMVPWPHGLSPSMRSDNPISNGRY
jgi:hypothetical protein